MPRRAQKRRLVVLPLWRLFPNMITIAGMCCGLSAIRLASEGRFEAAVALLVAAAIIDGMDGRIARFLNSTSTFGAQLDSLSDFVCFGVAPAIVLYTWKLNQLKGIGWALVLFFAVCCALRLARFNTNLAEESREPWQTKFFVGVPSPSGAMLALMPLVTSFYATTNIIETVTFTALWLPFIAVLMASRIPTLTAKKITVHHEWVLWLMIAGGLVTVLVLTHPWEMFNICGLVYCATIPFSVRHYRKLAATRKTGPSADDESPSVV